MARGYFRDGIWVQAGSIGAAGTGGGGFQIAARAAAEATLRVRAGESSARTELFRLLSDYPLLKIDSGKDEQHPLDELSGLFAQETVGRF
jgi:hypothetical protein